MVLICPNCKEELDAPRTAKGKKVKCPLCEQTFEAQLPKAIVLADEE
jgi:LSD1 subclass zinc finger protein